MIHIRWRLSGEAAMALYDQCPQACLFESEEEGTWLIDVYTPDLNDIDPALLEQYPEHTMETLAENDWVAVSQSALPPIAVDQIYVHTCHYPPSDQHPINLCIEATQAFGSGHHNTTQSCLHLIQNVWRGPGWHKALDVGCGSGVLAMAMNRLHPGSASGFDCEDYSVDIAKNNAEINQCPTHFFQADAIPQHTQVDCVVANIVDTVLIAMAPSMPSSASQLILSGMLAHQAPCVQAAYASWGWSVTQTHTSGDWVSLWLSRNTTPPQSDDRLS
jgi:ribosomal protein L11 methyltransferase